MAFGDNLPRSVVEAWGRRQVVLGGTVHLGDPLAYEGLVEGWVQADASEGLYPELVAGQDGEEGQTIVAYRGAVVAGFTGGETGTPLYVSDTAGRYSASPGSEMLPVGMMLSQTEAVIAPGRTAQVARASFANDAVADVPLVVSGTFDACTVKIQVPDACVVQAVTYWTAAALGSGMGIDVVNGGAAGAGTDVICSCSDNLNGVEAENTISGAYSSLAEGHYLNVVFDNYATPTLCVVTIWLRMRLNTMV